jgi:hypothetical protein
VATLQRSAVVPGERKAYLENIHKATAGLEAGRVALVKAKLRLAKSG